MTDREFYEIQVTADELIEVVNFIGDMRAQRNHYLPVPDWLKDACEGKAIK